jgi:hypothetical protein
MGSRSSTASKHGSASGGWAGIDDDSDEEDDGKGEGERRCHRPGLNKCVNDLVPDGVGFRARSSGEVAAETKQETLKQPMRQDQNEGEANRKSKVEEEEVESPTQIHEEPESMVQPGAADDEDLKTRIPGSFDIIGPPEVQGQGATWGNMLRQLTIK